MNTPIVLVPLDGSVPALSALPVAKAFAELQKATLHFVHITHETAPFIEMLPRLGLDARELRGAVLHIQTGEPAAEILQIARDHHCLLIVMCTHTAAAHSRPILGGTALAVLQGTLCPLVLVPPDRGLRPWSLRRILLPHDGTPTSSAAIRPAAELARLADAELNVLHVATSRTHPPLEHGSLTLRYMDQPQHEWPGWAEEFIGRLSCVCPLDSLRVQMLLAHGEPGDEVVRVAADHSSDLIVLAWRGVWERPRALTIKSIVDHAACPVMIVRTAA